VVGEHSIAVGKVAPGAQILRVSVARRVRPLDGLLRKGEVALQRHRNRRELVTVSRDHGKMPKEFATVRGSRAERG
jgi:hypothetical protein